MNRLLSIGAPALAFALAACSAGTDQTTGLSANFNLTADDTAQAAVIPTADATSEDVDVMLASEATIDAGGFLGDRIPAPNFDGSDTVRVGFWSFSSACTYNTSSGRFDCPAVTHNGLTLTRSVAFFDANGAPMPKFNDTTTASANFQVSVTGVRVLGNGADTISRQRNMTVTGLLGHETSRTWNGTGSRTDGGYRVDSAKTRTYHVSGNATFANIVVDLPRIEHPFPMSGTVTRNVTGTGTVVKGGVTKTFTVTKTVTVTFNGTRYVPMMVGTTAYTLDLVTGKATKN